MTSIRKSDTLEEISLEYFNQHYALEGRQKSLKRLLDAATEILQRVVNNTKDVYYVDTILRGAKWRVQLKVKYNLDFSSTIDQELIADMLHTLDIANDISFMSYHTVGYLHEEVIITLTLTVLFK